jgi:hypothetical protein
MGEAWNLEGAKVQVKQYSTEAQKQLTTLSTFISKTAKSSAGLFELGLITAPEYKATLDTIMESTAGLGEEQRKLLMLNVFQKLGAGAGELIGSLRTAQEETLVLTLLTSGLILAENARLKVLKETTDPKVRREIIAGLTAQLNGYLDTMTKVISAEEEDGKIKGGDSVKGKINAIKAKTQALVRQTESYKILRKANIDNATATELSNDAEIASLILNARKNKTLPKTIALIREYTKAQKESEAAAEKFQSEDEQFESNLSRTLAIANLREKLIDIQFAAKLKAENDKLAEQEKSLRDVNDLIDAITKADIDPLQAQIAANNFALEGIALQEDAINEKYETQIKSLDKIASINQEINNIQKQRMSIADALTRGDISAAAQAVQEARAQQAESAISGQRNALTAGRDAAIGALGRNALEKENKQLQYDISVIENTKLLIYKKQKTEIEGQIQASQRRIEDIKLEVENLKAAAVYAGQTRQNIEDQADLFRLAKEAGIPYSAELIKQLANAQGIEAAIKALETTVTTDHIIRTTHVTGGSDPDPSDSGVVPSEPGKDKKPVEDKKVVEVEPPAGGGGTKEKTNQPFYFTPGQQNLSAAAKQGIINSAKQDQAMANRAADAAKAAATAKATSLAKQDAAMASRSPISIGGMTLVPSKYSPISSTYQIPKQYRANGGLIPKYMAEGGFAKGTDTVPAMLTPGEFVVKKFAVDSFGVDNLRDINNGTFNDKSKSGQNTSSSVYNYGINVNVSNSNASTDEIARAVITQIKNIDNQRIRGQKY